MSTLSERFAQLSLLRPELAKGEIAIACGVKASSVSDWYSGETKSLKGSTAAKAATLFGVSMHWLTDGVGPMKITEAEYLDETIRRYGIKPAPASPSKKPPSTHGGDFTIPQYETGGAMGNGLVLADQPGVIHSWHVTPEWVRKNVANCTSVENLCIVTGFGDSMLGMYNPGDPLLVDKGVNTCESDGVYFFRVGDEGFIKRLQRIPGEGVLVISENLKYRDWTIKPEMDFQVLAKVVKMWKGDNY